LKPGSPTCYLVSCPALLAFSVAIALWPIWRVDNPGVPFHDQTAQSAEFMMCAFALGTWHMGFGAAASRLVPPPRCLQNGNATADQEGMPYGVLEQLRRSRREISADPSRRNLEVCMLSMH
jgi:hypothetical protein